MQRATALKRTHASHGGLDSQTLRCRRTKLELTPMSRVIHCIIRTYVLSKPLSAAVLARTKRRRYLSRVFAANNTTLAKARGSLLLRS